MFVELHITLLLGKISTTHNNIWDLTVAFCEDFG